MHVDVPILASAMAMDIPAMACIWLVGNELSLTDGHIGLEDS